MNINDLLQETAAQLPGKMAFRIRDKIVLLTPAYQPMSIPQIGTPTAVLWGMGMGGGGAVVPEELMREQIAGQSVNFSVENAKFTEAVTLFRKQTGVNIVIDAAIKDKIKKPITMTLDYTRVLTVLNQLAEQCELQCVFRDNVYFITSPFRAK